MRIPCLAQLLPLPAPPPPVMGSLPLHTRLQISKEETDLVRKELGIAQERLDVCNANIKAAESRETSCRQDKELCHAELAASAAREAEAEKALRQNDCAGVKKDLQVYRERAEESEVEKHALRRRQVSRKSSLGRLPPSHVASIIAFLSSDGITSYRRLRNYGLRLLRHNLPFVCCSCRLAESEARCQSLTQLQAKLEAAEKANSELDAERKALAVELQTTKRALDLLTKSLDFKERYEQLQVKHRNLEAAHEREWLPHWLEDVSKTSWAAACAVWHAAERQIAPWVESIQATGSKLWELRIKPGVHKVDAALSGLPGWGSVRTAAEHSIRSIGGRAAALGSAFMKRTVRAEEAFEKAIIVRMQRVDALKPVARHSVVHYALWGLVASLVIPAAYALVSAVLQILMHMLRPGTALVQLPASGSEYNIIENKLGYAFEQSGALERAFKQANGGALAWLGNLLVQLLAAEGAIQEESSDVAAVRGAAQKAASAQELAAKAERAGLGRYVHAGAGSKSVAAAAARRADLYAACIGAAYVDSGFDIKAARKALTGPQKAGDSARKS